MLNMRWFSLLLLLSTMIPLCSTLASASASSSSSFYSLESLLESFPSFFSSTFLNSIVIGDAARMLDSSSSGSEGSGSDGIVWNSFNYYDTSCWVIFDDYVYALPPSYRGYSAVFVPLNASWEGYDCLAFSPCGRETDCELASSFSASSSSFCSASISSLGLLPSSTSFLLLFSFLNFSLPPLLSFLPSSSFKRAPISPVQSTVLSQTRV
jgi:hypothetical protein